MMHLSAAILILTLFTGNAQGPSAADLFKDGHFPEALAACNSELQADPKNSSDLIIKGRILIFRNQLREAEKVLRPLVDTRRRKKDFLSDDDYKLCCNLLGECYYREDRFDKAEPLFKEGGKDAKAEQLADFNGIRPNAISPKRSVATIPFITTDPLPVVTLTANGKTANFIIDTGAADVVLDPDFAATIGVKPISSQTGTFAGGAQAVQQTARLDSLQLGSITVKNLPVHLLSTKNFSEKEFNAPISGIIGTILFYHFQATLDYPEQKLILAPRAKNSTYVTSAPIWFLPFWLVSDHFMVTWGRLGSSQDRLFLIDTGLAGAAFTGPKSITDEAGITVSMDNAQMGQGGGGAVKMAPYEIPNISLGPVSAAHLIGVYGAFPDAFENSLGFHLSGIISHQFFRPYAVTFDFDNMRVVLRK